MYNYRVSQNAPFSVKHSRTGGKRKLEWLRVRKYIRFLILFSPRANNCKKPFRGFSEIHYTAFLMNLHHFSYFDPTKKSAIFFVIIFRGIPYWLRYMKKNLRVRTMYFFGFGFWALLAPIFDEIENSKSKIILQLPHQSFARYHRILIFLGHPSVHIYDTVNLFWLDGVYCFSLPLNNFIFHQLTHTNRFWKYINSDKSNMAEANYRNMSSRPIPLNDTKPINTNLFSVVKKSEEKRNNFKGARKKNLHS